MTDTVFAWTLMLGIQLLEKPERKYFFSHIPYKAIEHKGGEEQVVEPSSWTVVQL